jgi:hypothetical protein
LLSKRRRRKGKEDAKAARPSQQAHRVAVELFDRHFHGASLRIRILVVVVVMNCKHLPVSV